MRIEDIKDPSFLVKASDEEKTCLASDMRQLILKTASEKGGHLSANLGVVELTIALETVFNDPHDRIIWDVGHQTYAHKILTGRARDFAHLGEDGGLGRFPSYRESDRDGYETGHSSTSIAALIGFLLAREAGKPIGNVVAVIGDSAFQNGLALASFNYLGSRRDLKGIVVLNDNGMAISENFRPLGPIARGTGASALSAFLSALGFLLIECPEGHDMASLTRAFTRAKEAQGSVLVHVTTQKGKGYALSEADRLGRYHGTAPFDLATGKALSGGPTWGDEVARLLMEHFAQDPSLRLLSPAMIYNSGLAPLAARYPERVIDCGITEDMAVVMAAAMAHTGLPVIVSLYSTFLQRAYDALAHDVARPHEHVIVLVDHAGLVAHDGSTHQGVLDMSLLLALPDVVVASPRNTRELASCFAAALAGTGPWFIRYPQGPAPHEDKNDDITPVTILHPLARVNVLTYGRLATLYDRELPEDIGLVSVLYQKPFSLSALPDFTGRTLIIAEEAFPEGGFASVVVSEFAKNGVQAKIRCVSVPEDTDFSGDTTDLLRKCGLLPAQIMPRGES